MNYKMIDLDNVCEWCFTDKELEVIQDGDYNIKVCKACKELYNTED